MKFILAILGILAMGFLSATVYLWRTSKYPGAEIGNMDGSLAKAFGIGFLLILMVFAGLLYFRK